MNLYLNPLTDRHRVWTRIGEKWCGASRRRVVTVWRRPWSYAKGLYTRSTGAATEKNKKNEIENVGKKFHFLLIVVRNRTEYNFCTILVFFNTDDNIFLLACFWCRKIFFIFFTFEGVYPLEKAPPTEEKNKLGCLIGNYFYFWVGNFFPFKNKKMLIC